MPLKERKQIFLHQPNMTTMMMMRRRKMMTRRMRRTREGKGEEERKEWKQIDGNEVDKL